MKGNANSKRFRFASGNRGGGLSADWYLRLESETDYSSNVVGWGSFTSGAATASGP
jgi:hypothetical protein